MNFGDDVLKNRELVNRLNINMAILDFKYIVNMKVKLVSVIQTKKRNQCRITDVESHEYEYHV